MTRPEDCLAVIPARGGSRSIPRKNVRDFAGRPLIAWTIEAARASGVFARIVCSTDDDEIADVARAWGAESPFRRPAALAGDAAPTAPVVRHAVLWLRDNEGWMPKFVVVLEPTSPTRRPAHIREAVRLLVESGADSLASVSEVPHHYHPEKLLRLSADGTLTGAAGIRLRDMVHRRQDLSRYHAFNGLIFACRAAVLFSEPPTLWGERVAGYLVDGCYAVDIDAPGDWPGAEARLREILAEEATP